MSRQKRRRLSSAGNFPSFHDAIEGGYLSDSSSSAPSTPQYNPLSLPPSLASASSSTTSITNYLLEEGWKSGLLSDIQIELFEKRYKLHKFILCQSDYFKTLFTSGNEWTDLKQEALQLNSILFDNADGDFKISEEALVYCLQFMYTVVKGEQNEFLYPSDAIITIQRPGIPAPSPSLPSSYSSSPAPSPSFPNFSAAFHSSSSSAFMPASTSSAATLSSKVSIFEVYNSAQYLRIQSLVNKCEAVMLEFFNSTKVNAAKVYYLLDYYQSSSKDHLIKLMKHYFNDIILRDPGVYDLPCEVMYLLVSSVWQSATYDEYKKYQIAKKYIQGKMESIRQRQMQLDIVAEAASSSTTTTSIQESAEDLQERQEEAEKIATERKAMFAYFRNMLLFIQPNCFQSSQLEEVMAQEATDPVLLNSDFSPYDLDLPALIETRKAEEKRTTEWSGFAALNVPARYDANESLFIDLLNGFHITHVVEGEEWSFSFFGTPILETRKIARIILKSLTKLKKRYVPRVTVKVYDDNTGELLCMETNAADSIYMAVQTRLKYRVTVLTIGGYEVTTTSSASSSTASSPQKKEEAPVIDQDEQELDNWLGRE